jgi:hypothetical protein
VSDKRDALAGLAIVAAGTAALALINKLVPKPEPKPWGSAFWLDPELWDRVPYNERTGGYGRCWDYLDAKVVDGPNLAHPKPPAIASVGTIRTDHERGIIMVRTLNRWVDFAPAGALDGNAYEMTYQAHQRKLLWLKVAEHGWVKSGSWDTGFRCHGCWENHTPGYHNRSGDAPEGIWIRKPHFAEWLDWQWNATIREPDLRKAWAC